MARDWIARRIARSRRFTAIDRMIGRHGFKVVLLSRLSPISPFVILNYLFSLTKVSFREYALGSLIGMIPGTVMFVYFGAGLRSLAEVTAYAKGQLPPTPAERVFFWAGLAVTVSDRRSAGAPGAQIAAAGGARGWTRIDNGAGKDRA